MAYKVIKQVQKIARNETGSIFFNCYDLPCQACWICQTQHTPKTINIENSKAFCKSMLSMLH